MDEFEKMKMTKKKDNYQKTFGINVKLLINHIIPESVKTSTSNVAFHEAFRDKNR